MAHAAAVAMAGARAALGDCHGPGDPTGRMACSGTAVGKKDCSSASSWRVSCGERGRMPRACCADEARAVWRGAEAAEICTNIGTGLVTATPGSPRTPLVVWGRGRPASETGRGEVDAGDARCGDRSPPRTPPAVRGRRCIAARRLEASMARWRALSGSALRIAKGRLAKPGCGMPGFGV